MNNFEFKNPTKIIFGKDAIKNITNEIPENAKVLMLYGGGSIKKNGIYEQVTAALEKIDVIEFGGIPANPEYTVLINALEVIKKENITYLLAVGGGSVIDGAKFLSAAAVYDGDAPWDIFNKKNKYQTRNAFWYCFNLAGNRFRNEFWSGNYKKRN